MSEPTSKPVQPQEDVSYATRPFFKPARMKPICRVILLLVLALVVVAMLIPNTAIAFLREQTRLGVYVNWVEALWPAVDMDHVVAFAILGFAGGLALPRLGVARAALALAGVAAFTEVVQCWVPGRTPLVSDVLLDIAGGLAGYAVGWLLSQGLDALASRVRGRDKNTSG